MENVGKMRYDLSPFTDLDIYLFRRGSHFRLYEKMGAHLLNHSGESGIRFALWAPNAESVSVIGNFNGWTPFRHVLRAREDGSGIYEGFLPGLGENALYKYHIRSRFDGYEVDKGDPFAFAWEIAPRTASVVRFLDYRWHDDEWMGGRAARSAPDAPLSIYEIHAGSWRHDPERKFSLSYRDLAPRLTEYLLRTGFTHLELMPVMEHPFYASWGYQTLGYFAPTSRFGDAQDLMYLIDYLHQAGIGVILDWVPSHFPDDEYGLVFFDGTHLYEHADFRRGVHPDWGSRVFNYGRNEVRAFLGSSALFWLDRYHADGLRIDAVASMLYLDYSREEGEWIPNEFGGNEDLEAMAFLRELNQGVHSAFPEVLTVAEESTAWPMVTRPPSVGGLGFDMKWNMGWMHDILNYAARDSVHRKYHHDSITFSIWYAFSESFILPLSHDEVVHEKGSLMEKMPGDEWQKFASLRLFLGYMYAHPGKKLLFMGGEFGQRREWNHDRELDWDLLDRSEHSGLQRWVADLNGLYRGENALHELDFDPEGFRWIDCSDVEQSVIAFLRRGRAGSRPLLVICNFTSVPRHQYRMGVPKAGLWKELLNSDGREYGGSGQGNFGGVATEDVSFHGHHYSLVVTLPPLGIVILGWAGKEEEK